VQVELGEDARDVGVGRAAGDQDEHLELARGELGQGRRRPTLISQYPLALLCAVVAVRGALRRWLGIGAGVTAVALVANGAFVETDTVPALLLFILWTLCTGVVLVRRAATRAALNTVDRLSTADA
jgi:hypothetical protein